ncbi:MAG: integrase [Acidobacteria bacterium]|nr:MAG: integrase [Acidobacteriota bacterium]
MRYIINERLFMRRQPEGPLAAHVRPFGQWAFEQGYSKHRVHRRVGLAAGFSQWLGARGIRAGGVSGEHVGQYLRHRSGQKQIERGDNPSLKQFLDFLRRGGFVAAEKTNSGPITPVGQCVREFEAYLQDQCALAPITVYQYARYIRLFLTKRFGKQAVKLESLRPQDVCEFVQQESLSKHFTYGKRITTSLRSFFRFARYRGVITADLAAAVPKVAGWSMTGIPKAIAAGEIGKLLSSIDRSHAKGRRDYAILLLLARLGMRSGEIARLDLDDIDWNSGSLKVRGKGREARLPLPQDVGKAIVDYLRHGRPLTTSRRLFLRTKAPYRGFRDSTVIAGIVRYAIERAGVRSPTHGAHQFRHALATRMLHRGGSLKEIGELLGHRSIEVTRIYAKVDIPALRTLALRWPGGAL